MRCEKVGGILRTGQGRVVSLEVDPTHKVIGCYGTNNSVDLFYLLPDDKVKVKFGKRLKKERKKAEK